MFVQEISNITKKKMLISYRREYQAQASIKLNGSIMENHHIEFSLEMTPYGEKLIRIRFLDDINYPLVPLMQELKTKIKDLETAGTLPN